MRKKIIFFIPNIDSGGIEKNLILLSNYFIKNNHVVEIIYSRISKKIQIQINKKIILKKATRYINFKFLSERVNGSINCFIFSLLGVKKNNNNSVLFSMQDHPFGIILSICKNIPSIIRIANHPIGSLRYFNNYFKFKLKLFIKFFFYHFATVIICNSDESSNYFRNTLLLKKKIFTIYNPIVRKKFTSDFKRNKYELLTICRLEKQKNLEGLIKAFSIVSKKIPKLRLTIVGNGSQKKLLNKLASNLKISKYIYFKNFSKPNYFYKRKGVFILNSFFEGLPNVLIESIQYKIPVISTNCLSGPSEILARGKYGYLVEVNNYYKLAKKIIYVIKNYNNAISKAKMARKSLDRFNFKNQCEKYEKVILNL